MKRSIWWDAAYTFSLSFDAVPSPQLVISTGEQRIKRQSLGEFNCQADAV